MMILRRTSKVIPLKCNVTQRSFWENSSIDILLNQLNGTVTIPIQNLSVFVAEAGRYTWTSR